MTYDELLVTKWAKGYARRINEDLEKAYRLGWRAAGAAIAERIAAASADITNIEGYGAFSAGLDHAEEIARDEVRGE